MNPNSPSTFSLFASAGLQFFGAVAGMSLLGWWLDGKLGTTPWLAVIGVLVGSVGGFYNLWRILKLSESNDSSN